MKKITALTHLSYNEDESPFIGSALPISITKNPKGRMTGVFGRQVAVKAAQHWWKKVQSLFNKPLSKVELYISDNGKNSNNQSLDDIENIDVLNILLAQVPLTDQLDIWCVDYSPVERMHIGDRDFFRRIVKNPEIINVLFERPELSHVKAIIWPAVDPDNNAAYIKMITLRSMDDVDARRIFNFEGDPESIPYKLVD